MEAAVIPCRQQAPRAAYEVELQAIEDYRRFAALTIQRYYRGWIVRLHRARQEAACREQKESSAAQQAEARRLYAAARAIQDCWRSYKNRRIYRFYRDLIKFREATDPRHLLRCINAPEAALVDPAAGLHIRFRLGGSSFPPILLYKVFTHRPVTDICAFGPRNYAAEAAACKPTAAAAAMPHKTPAEAAAVQMHSHAPAVSSSEIGAHSGWYCRDDRNSWRPVVELQQQMDYQQNACSNSSSSSTWQRKGIALRRARCSRLHVAHCSGGSGEGSGQGSSPCAADEAEEAGYSSEPELQGGRGTGSPCSHSRRQQQYYHHSPLVRRTERARQLKQRRRQWLLKMYRTGMQSCTGPGSSPAVGSEGTTAASAGSASRNSSQAACTSHQQQLYDAGQQAPPCQRCSSEEQLLQQLEQQLLSTEAADQTSSSSCAAQHGDSSSKAGNEDINWDLDDLLALGLDAGILSWAQKLDFDSYQQQWAITAVTLASEVVVPQSEYKLLQQLA